MSGAAGGEVVSPAGQAFIGGDGGDRDAREVGDDAGESSGLVRVELVAEQDNVGAPGVGQIRVEPLLSNGDVVGEVAPASSSAVFETCQNPVDVVDLGDRWMVEPLGEARHHRPHERHVQVSAPGRQGQLDRDGRHHPGGVVGVVGGDGQGGRRLQVHENVSGFGVTPERDQCRVGRDGDVDPIDGTDGCEIGSMRGPHGPIGTNVDAGRRGAGGLAEQQVDALVSHPDRGECRQVVAGAPAVHGDRLGHQVQVLEAQRLMLSLDLLLELGRREPWGGDLSSRLAGVELPPAAPVERGDQPGRQEQPDGDRRGRRDLVTVLSDLVGR